MGKTPGISMKHWHYWQYRIILGERRTIGESYSHRMEEDRAMTIDHAFRIGRGTRGVAHCSRSILFQLRPIIGRGLICDKGLVINGWLQLFCGIGRFTHDDEQL